MKSLIIAGILTLFTGFALAQDCPEGYEKVLVPKEEAKATEQTETGAIEDTAFFYESETLIIGEEALDEEANIQDTAGMNEQQPEARAQDTDDMAVDTVTLGAEDLMFEDAETQGKTDTVSFEFEGIDREEKDSMIENIEFESKTDEPSRMRSGLGSIGEGAVDVVQQGGEFVGDAGEVVIDGAGDAIQHGAPYAKDAGEVAVDIVQQGAEFVGDAGEVVIDGIGDAAEAVYDGVTGLFRSDNEPEATAQTADVEMETEVEAESDVETDIEVEREAEVEVETEKNVSKDEC